MTGHVLELLSEFVDGALPDEDRRAVENHLSACGSCRGELEDLRGAVASLASLPKQPLPPGFMARLQARRERAKPPEKEYAFLPFPARVAAFALSSFLVGFVVFESYRNKPSRMISSADGGMAASSSLMSAPETPAAAPAERYAALKKARSDESTALNEGDMSRSFGGLSAGGAGGGGALRQSRSRGAPAARGSAPGRPLDAEGSFDAAPAAMVEPSFTNEELNARLEQEKKELGIRRIVSNAEKRAEKAAELATPKGFIAALGLADNQAQAVKLSGAKPDLRAAAASPAKPKAAVAPFGGAVGRDAQELREAWREAELSGPPPRVDFEKHTAVIPPGVMVDVRESQGVIIVRYRPGPRQYALIESTKLPIAFELKR